MLKLKKFLALFLASVSIIFIATVEAKLPLEERIIMKEEGFHSKPYSDAHGYSIGYGHFLSKRELEKQSVYGISYKNGLSKPEAQIIMREDIKKVKYILSRYWRALRYMNEEQKAELTDLVYNCGLGPKLSTALRRMSVTDNPTYDDFESVWEQMDCIKSEGRILKGLIKRRARNQYHFFGKIHERIKKHLSETEIEQIKRGKYGRK